MYSGKFIQVHQQFQALEVPAGHTDGVLLGKVINLGQTPVNGPQVPLLVVDHDVVWLGVPVHGAGDGPVDGPEE